MRGFLAIQALFDMNSSFFSYKLPNFMPYWFNKGRGMTGRRGNGCFLPKGRFTNFIWTVPVGNAFSDCHRNGCGRKEVRRYGSLQICPGYAQLKMHFVFKITPVPHSINMNCLYVRWLKNNWKFLICSLSLCSSLLLVLLSAQTLQRTMREVGATKEDCK